MKFSDGTVNNSGHRLDNANWTHLVLESGKPDLPSTGEFNFKNLYPLVPSFKAPVTLCVMVPGNQNMYEPSDLVW